MIPALSGIFITSFFIALSGAMMPGPLLTVTISESSRKGVIAGPAIILGHGLLEVVVVVILLTGFGPFLRRDDVFTVIALVGGAILLWMGGNMLRELPGLKLDLQNDGVSSRNMVVSGAVLSAVNPYFLFWWSTIGLGYILFSVKYGAVGVIVFFLGHIAADLGWYSCVAYGIAKGKGLMSDRVYRTMIGCCAVVLVGFSGYFFWSGIDRML